MKQSETRPSPESAREARKPLGPAAAPPAPGTCLWALPLGVLPGPLQVREFPDALGRRIRRHFRRYYALKSAVDETKIFAELSGGLRQEVGEGGGGIP